MALPTDTTFGAGFDADAFRSAIRSTMQMGLPTDVGLQPTFRWTTEREYTRADDDGDPYDWTATPVAESAHDDVLAICAVEFGGDTVEDTAMGHFDTVDAVITILDVDYATVNTADHVLLGGNNYIIKYVTSVGLFSVTTYTIYCSSVDEA